MSLTPEQRTGPYLHNGLSTPRVMLDVVVALLPAVAAGVVFFGPATLVVGLLAVVSACLTEWILISRKLTLSALWGDGSAAVTGLLLGLTLSPLSPWWIPLLGGVLAIGLGKQAFGGLGRNSFNPALVARAIIILAWPAHAVRWAQPFDGLASATPLVTGNAPLMDLFVGRVSGAVGETSVLALLIGGIYLLYRGHIDWRIPSAVILGTLAGTWALGGDALYGVMAGGVMIAAVFMATDMVTSPVTRWGRVLFGLLVGVMIPVIRHYTVFPEGVTFAILLGNAMVPLLDRYTVTMRFGEKTWLPRLAPGTAGLIAVVLIGGALVGLGWNLAEEASEAQAHADLEAKLSRVLPGMDSFEERELNGRLYYAGLKDGAEEGFVIYSSAQGFNAPVQVLLGVNLDGRITGLEVLQHQEDPGLGSKITQDWFLGQFVDLDRSSSIVPGGDVEGISGATVSVRAVTQAVAEGLDFYAAVAGDAPADPDALDLSQVLDGEYEGQATGFGGTMTIRVTVEGGRITAIQVVDHQETPDIAEPAFETMIQRILEAQDLDVDTVSGATVTAEALISAIHRALTETDPAEPEPSGMDARGLADGEYSGSAESYGGPLEVSVTVSGGEIQSIQVVDHHDTPDIAEPAFDDVIDLIISAQNTRVDAVSGATISCQALMEAVEEALSGDPTAEDPLDLSLVPDGVYRASAEGFGGELTVEAEVAGGQLVSIDVVEHHDTPDMAEPAFEELIEEILERQEIQVDVVSGATVTSEALMEALRRALEGAL